MKILTFDIEDWFHLLDNDYTKSVNQWNKYESRIHVGMEHIYDIILNKNISATFL